MRGRADVMECKTKPQEIIDKIISIVYKFAMKDVLNKL
jgi:hypothetical protein